MMAVPRILFAVPVLALGIFLPTAGAAIKPAPPGALGMSHEGFTSTEVTVHRGQTLTLDNNSRFMHTVGAGKGGTLADNPAVPMLPRKMMATNNIYTTGQ
jgi:hypothetical protein